MSHLSNKPPPAATSSSSSSNRARRASPRDVLAPSSRPWRDDSGGGGTGDDLLLSNPRGVPVVGHGSHRIRGTSNTTSSSRISPPPPRRSQAPPPVVAPTLSIAAASTAMGGHDLVLGFEHRMNTDERRRMREREAAISDDAVATTLDHGSKNRRSIAAAAAAVAPAPVSSSSGVASKRTATTGSGTPTTTSRKTPLTTTTTTSTSSSSNSNTLEKASASAYSRSLERRQREAVLRKSSSNVESHVDLKEIVLSGTDHAGGESTGRPQKPRSRSSDGMRATETTATAAASVLLLGETESRPISLSSSRHEVRERAREIREQASAAAAVSEAARMALPLPASASSDDVRARARELRAQRLRNQSLERHQPVKSSVLSDQQQQQQQQPTENASGSSGKRKSVTEYPSLTHQLSATHSRPSSTANYLKQNTTATATTKRQYDTATSTATAATTATAQPVNGRVISSAVVANAAEGNSSSAPARTGSASDAAAARTAEDSLSAARERLRAREEARRRERAARSPTRSRTTSPDERHRNTHSTTAAVGRERYSSKSPPPPAAAAASTHASSAVLPSSDLSLPETAATHKRSSSSSAAVESALYGSRNDAESRRLSYVGPNRTLDKSRGVVEGRKQAYSDRMTKGTLDGRLTQQGLPPRSERFSPDAAEDRGNRGSQDAFATTSVKGVYVPRFERQSGADKNDLHDRLRGMENKAERNVSVTSSVSDTADTELSVDDDDYVDDDETEESDEEEDEETYTILINLKEAVDLPPNVLPNLPLCPVLKFGLIKLPASDFQEDERGADPSAKGKSMAKMAKTGLSKLSNVRVRCTSSKILSKRDNGSMEFHEEFRWDRVRRPTRSAILIELCARAGAPPTNMDESPLIEIKEESTDTRTSSKVSIVEPQPPPPPPSDGTPKLGISFFASQPQQAGGPTSTTEPASGGEGDSGIAGGLTGMRALWRKGRQQFEQRTQQAAGSDKSRSGSGDEARPSTAKERMSELLGSDPFRRSSQDSNAATQKEVDVTLVPPPKRRKLEMMDDIRVGTLVIPLTRLPLDKATCSNEIAKVEQWYQLDSNLSEATRGQSGSTWRASGASKMGARRNPSILLEIRFGAQKLVEDSEDELHASNFVEVVDEDGKETNLDTSSRSASKSDKQSDASNAKDQKLIEDPVLQPGVIDFITVVGARDIGDQKDDDGARGWVNTTPECVLLEQFPPNNEFHVNHGRNVCCPNKIEWFCFPEGCRLWRGSEPPSHADLNLKRFSASSPPNVATSIAAFDACLNCTTSFSWFVISSNSDEYGSRLVKTYGAVIRFYTPAPKGIDPTQDDYAQTIFAPAGGRSDGRGTAPITSKRLWVPMGICLTSNLPIVGMMEAILLRLCEALAHRAGEPANSPSYQRISEVLRQDLVNLIVNFQKPIAGVLHSSVPFLSGDRLHITLPPNTGLPPLPHGACIASVCRLLGADGLNFILAAVLTESKILIHSDDVSNLAMVAEVVTALIYPFTWALPYIPVLPEAMLEFVEAPLSYLLGVPSCSMKTIDPSALADVVVIDLDNGFSSPDYFDGRKHTNSTKVPTALPASVASQISKAVMRLLRAEEEVEEEYGTSGFPASRSFPRMEAESLAEREFRVAVAIQICGLVRGYRDCLFFVSASQPVFNRDKFLRNAPALFEEKRSSVQDGANGATVGVSQRVLSPRSKRFLSILVNCQHFHQFLETLDFEDLAFFHEVMDTFEEQKDDPIIRMKNSAALGDASSRLILALQTVEDKIPTYRVDRSGPKGRGRDLGDNTDKLFENRSDDEIGFRDDGNLIASFTNTLLQPIVPPADPPPSPNDLNQKTDSAPVNDGATHSLSVRYLLELEKNPWRYFKLFDFCGSQVVGDEKQKTEGDSSIEVWERVKLREAIGDKRYRAWKLAQEQKLNPNDLKANKPTEDILSISEATTALDLTCLLSSVSDDTMSETSSVSSAQSSKFGKFHSNSSLSPEQQRVADAKDRDLLRRCLERAYDGSGRYRGSGVVAKSNTFVENGRDLISEAEIALRNPSAQRFLLSVLSQRSRLENQRKNDDDKSRRQVSSQSSLSRLQQAAFECLVRLCCAMLDACMESNDFGMAYALLTQTAGFCTLLTKDGKIPQNETNDASERDENTRVVYMATRIGLHPIFADLRLWEKVMNLHLEDSHNEKASAESTTSSRAPSPTDGQSTGEVKTKADSVEYEAAVGTIYEMVGYGIPAEELARFATRVSEEYGWFANERGHSLLMLARRLSLRREQTDEGIVAGENGDLEMIRSKASATQSDARAEIPRRSIAKDRSRPLEGKLQWSEVAWCHPAASSSSRSSLAKQLGSDASSVTSKVHPNDADKRSNEVKPGWEYMKRSPVTALAAFGSSVVVTGGLDGSVFLAHTIRFSSDGITGRMVKGIQLDWGSSGSRSITGSGSYMDGEFGVGAVSCLAAAKGPRYHSSALIHKSSKKGTIESIAEDDVLSAMEGSRIVAGTTGGDLRVWSVKDVYSAVLLARNGEEGSEIVPESRISHAGDAATSSFVAPSARKGGIAAIAVGNSHTRLKFSLRGRALSGHRGGVSCIDVPSHIYRPDSLVTGGADGLIKIWSLRAPTGRRTTADVASNVSSSMFSSGNSLDALTSQRNASTGRGGDALNILSGHSGRILFVKTAWHGDRLLSGGADSTIRVWDIAGGGGKCIHTLSGHCEWVTEAHFWGPNTIVSGSTDRSIALWDARVRNHPLFVLRHHQAPISRILVGSRTDPVMVSAAYDGTIATWDFRTLSEAPGAEPTHATEGKNNEKMICNFVRSPASFMDAGGGGGLAGNAIFLARGRLGSILSGGFDGIVREWDLATGSTVNEFFTGHCDAISSLNSLADSPLDGGGHEPGSMDQSDFGGFVTSSWDGTIRMRKLINHPRDRR